MKNLKAIQEERRQKDQEEAVEDALAEAAREAAEAMAKASEESDHSENETTVEEESDDESHNESDNESGDDEIDDDAKKQLNLHPKFFSYSFILKSIYCGAIIKQYIYLKYFFNCWIHTLHNILSMKCFHDIIHFM